MEIYPEYQPDKPAISSPTRQPVSPLMDSTRTLWRVERVLLEKRTARLELQQELSKELLNLWQFLKPNDRFKPYRQDKMD